jgi:hypothetical protein
LENDFILVASVSDGGTLASPLGYEPLVSQVGNNSPSYQISYKRVSGTIDTQITGLSASGLTDGDGDVIPAGIAHVASVYRGVSSTVNPSFTRNNGTGDPNPQQITGLATGAGVVAFGFLDNISITDANITAPTTPGTYTKTITQGVGQDNSGNDEATVMSAFRLVALGGTEEPGAFGVTGAGSEQNSSVTVALTPQTNNRFSAVTGGCGGSGGGLSAVFDNSTGTPIPLVIVGGGGGGGGGSTTPITGPAGGSGGAGGGGSGGNGNILVFDGIGFKLAGGGGRGATSVGPGLGGITLLGGTGAPTTGNNAGEVGGTYNIPPWTPPPAVGILTAGGRGANSPYNSLALPLYGSNATGGWNRGSGGGSSRVGGNILYTLVTDPTDCGGGGGAGYYGGGGGGVGAGGGGGGGGGGFSFSDPSVFVSSNLIGIGTIPPAIDSPNYLPGFAYGGQQVSGSGVDVIGKGGGNGLIFINYLVRA